MTNLLIMLAVGIIIGIQAERLWGGAPGQEMPDSAMEPMKSGDEWGPIKVTLHSRHNGKVLKTVYKFDGNYEMLSQSEVPH